MPDNIDTPAFAIYGLNRKLKAPEPPPPAVSETRPPSDEVLASNGERVYEYAATRPVFLNGKPTGQWQVSALRHRTDSTRRWITMKDQEDADDWCLRINAHRSKQV